MRPVKGVRMALTISRRSSLNAALSRVMIFSVMLQAFYQVLFQQLSNIVVLEQYFISQGRIGDDAGRAIVLQSSFGMLKAMQTSSAVSHRTVIGWAERERRGDADARHKSANREIKSYLLFYQIFLIFV